MLRFLTGAQFLPPHVTQDVTTVKKNWRLLIVARFIWLYKLRLFSPKIISSLASRSINLQPIVPDIIVGMRQSIRTIVAPPVPYRFFLISMPRIRSVFMHPNQIAFGIGIGIGIVLFHGKLVPVEHCLIIAQHTVSVSKYHAQIILSIIIAPLGNGCT